MLSSIIGNNNQNKNSKELALIVLDEFRNNGLYVSEQNEDGFWHVKKKRLSEEKYNSLKHLFNTLNKNGHTESDIIRIEKENKRLYEDIQAIWSTMK